jgi:hypothetical protein
MCVHKTKTQYLKITASSGKDLECPLSFILVCILHTHQTISCYNLQNYEAYFPSDGSINAVMLVGTKINVIHVSDSFL